MIRPGGRRLGAALAIGLGLATVAGACGGSADRIPATELAVFAAASLGNALPAVQAAYLEVEPDLRLVVATGSSATLRVQVEQGAPADVFLSADVDQPAALEAAGLADGPSVAFATNGLVIIVPAANPGRIETPADLARPGVRIVTAGPEVPITRYADAVVARLAELPDLPSGFTAAYAGNLVSREDDVAAVVTKVVLGEADAALVYATDAVASGTAVRTIALPPEAEVSAAYAGLVVAGTPRAAEAHAFLDWLAGPAGEAVLARFGFGGAS